jgi:pimeloyl-ACP methyl ester carboxylesterase
MLWIYYIPAFILAYAVVQFGFVAWRLFPVRDMRRLKTPQNKLIGAGKTFEQISETESYTVSHTVIDGIERIVYTPKKRLHETPILMAHGMWHGAWCWEAWQKLFAEWGWESVAYSLPGHAKSPVQRQIWLCTLDYNLAFVRDEVKRLPRKPILMGHSMGGALSQWYLRHVGDDLPAVVLVASWTSHNAVMDSLPMFLKLDSFGMLLVSLMWNARPYVRNPQTAARALITDGALLSPDELFARLDSESALVTLQHNPPFWRPAENIKTPMLLLAGEKDAVIGVEPLRKSAAHYHADFVLVPEAGHNLMMEKSYQETARQIDEWLVKRIDDN